MFCPIGRRPPPRAGCCGLEVNELGVDVPVGNPVDEVECDEDGWGEPHRPRVDVVAERLFVSAHAPLHLKCGMGICERFRKVCPRYAYLVFLYFGSVEGSKSG